jgi:hypothetical protein
MIFPHRIRDEAALLAQARVMARARIARAFTGMRGGLAQGGSQLAPLVRRHPLLLAAAAFAIGLVGAVAGLRLGRGAAGRPPPPDAAAPRPGAGFLRRAFGEIALPFLLQRFAARTVPRDGTATDAPIPGGQP